MDGWGQRRAHGGVGPPPSRQAKHPPPPPKQDTTFNRETHQGEVLAREAEDALALARNLAVDLLEALGELGRDGELLACVILMGGRGGVETGRCGSVGVDGGWARWGGMLCMSGCVRTHITPPNNTEAMPMQM